ncbi:4-carboxy-4-hydroxy-2-oxoadipate aldolase/oxaloacetate decarboxylase [Streptomyces olivaceus]
MSYDPMVVTDIERVSAEEARALGEFGTATVHESYRKRGLLTGISGVVPGARLAGPAVTCLNYPADNLMLQVAIETCRPGDVLVVAVVGGEGRHGMFGDMLATACVARGLAGIVLDSCVRDVDDLRAMGFPVFSRGVSAQGTSKTGYGYVNVPVSCGNTVVYPGDAVVGDSDGVVVVERAAVPQTLTAARARVANETEARRHFADGAAPVDMSGLRPTLEANGIQLGTPPRPAG